MMKAPAFLSRAVPLLLLSAAVPAAHADTLFEDSFEQGLAAWTTATTAQGRVTASTDHGPATGSRHLVLDDSVNDSVYSVAEAMVSLDLSRKRNVILQFRAKSLGNEPHGPPGESFGPEVRAYDGVAVSTDGGSTWRAVTSLAHTGPEWTSHTVTLDPVIGQLGGDFGPDFRIRFSAWDNAPAPLDGIAIDDVLVTADVDQRAVVELADTLEEGSGPHTGTVLLHYPQDTPVTLGLFTTPGSPLVVPATVTIPAGATSATFTYQVAEDDLVTLTRTTSVTAAATGIASSTASVTVLDNDPFTVTLDFPESLKEGEFTVVNNATLTVRPAPAVRVQFGLTANPTGQLSFVPTPASLTLEPGQTSAGLIVRATDDTRIDGDVPVTVTCTIAGSAVATATVIAVDNDNPARELNLGIPQRILEGTSSQSSISIGGTLDYPLVVALQHTGGAEVTIPPTVTIPAGSSSAIFNIAVADNSLRDGTRTFPLQASAEGFTTSVRTVTVRDNEVGGYTFTDFPEMMNLGVPTSVRFHATDTEGNSITGLSGTVTLDLVLPDGSALPITPASVTLTNSIWSGTITVPETAAAGLRLRATNPEGISGLSAPFDGLRTLNMRAADLVWDAARGRIYAAVPATDTSGRASTVVAIDPVTLQVVASVPTGQDPRKLCLSQDGNTLHVSLYGNGTIARIDLNTMTVAGSFPVGTTPSSQVLYAEDISTVAGQPNTLVVSQGIKPGNTTYQIAVYDNGVKRPLTVDAHTVEPSADPTVYFGYTAGSLVRLKLGATGLTTQQHNRVVLTSFPAIQSWGNRIFAADGNVVDGVSLGTLGTIPDKGSIRVEPAENRVYFLRQDRNGNGNGTHLAAYDPDTFALTGQKRLPSFTDMAGPNTLVRWGTGGLAYRATNSVKFASTTGLVSAGAPANLKVAVTASPDPAPAGTPVTYRVQVTNSGPNPAPGTRVRATLSAGQTLNGATSPAGTPQVAGSVITLAAGDLAPAASAVLEVTVTPQTAGNPYCQVIADSRAPDPDGSDNLAVEFINVGYQSGPDRVNTLRLPGRAMVRDSARGLLWIAVGGTEPAPLGRSVVSVNPVTGEISKPIPLGGTPADNVMALSANGRYLYVGFTDRSQLLRLDLQANPPVPAHAPITRGSPEDSGTPFASDIEVLPGDGRSVLVGITLGTAVVINDLTPVEPGLTVTGGKYFEPTGTAGVYVRAHSNGPMTLSRIRVASGAIQELPPEPVVYTGLAHRMVGDGGLLFTSGASLIDATTLELKLSWPVVEGVPCLDTANERAYLVDGSTIRAYDLRTGLPAEPLTLPDTTRDYRALRCVRWGADGMAVLDELGLLHVLRWSAVNGGTPAPITGPPDSYFAALGPDLEADPDGDGLPAALEYLFGTSLDAPSANPLKATLTTLPEGRVLVLEFPRRSDAAGAYRIQTATGLTDWRDATGVTETVTATRMVDGIHIDTVRAEIPMTGDRGFVRIKANTP